MSKSEDALRASYKHIPFSRCISVVPKKPYYLVDRCVCTWLGKWYLDCRIASHSRSSVLLCSTDATVPLFFWASQCVCLIGGRRIVLMRPGQLFLPPPNDFFALFISKARHRHALRARLDAAALVAGRQKGRKKPKARAHTKTHPSGVPVAEKIIHSLSVINFAHEFDSRMTGGFTLELARSRTCVGSAFFVVPIRLSTLQRAYTRSPAQFLSRVCASTCRAFVVPVASTPTPRVLPLGGCGGVYCRSSSWQAQWDSGPEANLVSVISSHVAFTFLSIPFLFSFFA